MTATFDDHPHPATIQVPTGEANGTKLQVPAIFTGMEGKRLVLISPERISMSTPVSVEYNDAIFLGEVVLCKPDSDANYQVEICVEQILTGLQSLMALRAGLLGAGAVNRVPASDPALMPAPMRMRPTRN